MARFFFALLVLSALVVPATRTSAAAPRRQTISPVAARIVELVNAERAAAGLKPVTINPLLMAEAQRFSAVQAELGRLSHRGLDNTNAGQRLTKAGYRWAFYGENLAAGQESPEAVVAGWMNSASHRANVLHPLAKEIGIGHTVKSGDAAGYVNYYAMEAGARR